mmetsp:Transcript_5094/g.9961  ORF Transcript_5094/g.9961 Transcript_5094/m.9961 type:complete len:85 (-) Transcript_5094:22-276(-)
MMIAHKDMNHSPTRSNAHRHFGCRKCCARAASGGAYRLHIDASTPAIYLNPAFLLTSIKCETTYGFFKMVYLTMLIDQTMAVPC